MIPTTPRPHRRRASPRLALVVALIASTWATGTGCESCEDAPATPGDVADNAAAEAPPTRAPVPAPPGLAFEASLGGGAATLAALRGLAGRHPVGVVLPTSPAEVVASFVPGMPVGDAIADDAPLYLVGLRRDDGGDRSVSLVGATRLRRDAGAASLPGLVPGGPAGARWFGEAPAADAPAAAVIDDVLVFGERRDVVEAALPYIAFTLVPAPTEIGLHARVPEDFVAELRRDGEAALGEATADMLREAAEERGRHDAEPDFGEPEVAVRRLTAMAAGLLALVGDVGDLRASLVPMGSGTEESSVQLTIDGAVRGGSALAALLAEAPVSDASGTRALPANTALALSFAPPRGNAGGLDAFSFFASWREFAGSRLDARGSAAVDALERAWETAAGRESIFAFGGGADDAWLAVVDPAPRGPLPPSTVEAVAGSRFVASSLGSAFDCPRPARARRGEPLCPNAPALVIMEDEARRVVGLARAPAVFGAGEQASLGAHDAVRRALDAVGPEVLIGLVVFPSRLMPALGLSGTEALQQLSRVSAMAARPAPIAVGVSHRREDAGTRVRVTIAATNRAIEDALTLVGSI